MAALRPASVVYHVGADSEALAASVDAIALNAGIPRRPLHLQSLMHLPRLADDRGLVDATIATDEIQRIARDIPTSANWRCDQRSELKELNFTQLDEGSVRETCERFHYLRSHRAGSCYFGLVQSPGTRPIAIAVASPSDVPRLGQLARETLDAKNVAVISRVFAFEGAPQNTLSRLLSRVASSLRAHGHDALVTYVNPNLGFAGASYRASGWTLLGCEPNTRYRYIDSDYVTDRVLSRRFGPHSDREYSELLGRRFATSRSPLEPLLVFGRSLRRHTS